MSSIHPVLFRRDGQVCCTPTGFSYGLLLDQVFWNKYVWIRVWFCKTYIFLNLCTCLTLSPEWLCWVQVTTMISPLATILLFPFQPLISTKPEGDHNHPQLLYVILVWWLFTPFSHLLLCLFSTCQFQRVGEHFHPLLMWFSAPQHPPPCSSIVFAFCTRGCYWFHLLLFRLCSISLFLFLFQLALDVK